jgi:hypothetical protein
VDARAGRGLFGERLVERARQFNWRLGLLSRIAPVGFTGLTGEVRVSYSALLQVRNMPIKIENQFEGKLPRNTLQNVESALGSVPREHLRGVERLRLVDVVTEPRARVAAKGNELPGLYHPRQGTQGAWFEIAITPLTSANKPFHKRIIPRLSFKGNLAAVIFSLVGQHYYLTLRHSVKRGSVEPAVRAYVEKQLKVWNEQQHKIRAKLFKPLQPTLERWSRSLAKKAAEEKKRKG